MSEGRNLVAKCVVALAMAAILASGCAAARPMATVQPRSPGMTEPATESESVSSDAKEAPRPLSSPHAAEPPPPPPAPTEDAAAKAYDHGDIEQAKAIAITVLAKDPNNIRMLRLAISASCINNEPVDAQKYYARLIPSGRSFMKSRCARYGITLTDP